jgi:polyisoprenoid-binding protein YceI
MRNLKTLIGIYLLIALPALAFGQYRLDDKTSTLVIEGTSSLHDWEIEAKGIKGSATMNAQNELTSISDLTFSVVVKQLESGKGAMDKNTFEALKESKYPEVTYKINKINKITPVGNNTYKLSTTGDLTVAGTTKPVTMEVNATVKGNTVSFDGAYTMKMTSFNVDPPTAMFGTIKTGDEVTIKFNVNYKKS